MVVDTFIGDKVTAKEIAVRILPGVLYNVECSVLKFFLGEIGRSKAEDVGSDSENGNQFHSDFCIFLVFMKKEEAHFLVSFGVFLQ